MNTESIRQQVSNFPFARAGNLILDENNKCPDCSVVLEEDNVYGFVYKLSQNESFMTVIEKAEINNIYDIYDELLNCQFYQLNLNEKKLKRFFAKRGVHYGAEEFWSEACLPFRERLLRNLLMEKGLIIGDSSENSSPQMQGTGDFPHLDIWKLKLKQCSLLAKHEEQRAHAVEVQYGNILKGSLSNLRL